MRGQPNVTFRDENTITNIKNVLAVFNRRIDTAEKNNSDLGFIFK